MLLSLAFALSIARGAQSPTVHGVEDSLRASLRALEDPDDDLKREAAIRWLVATPDDPEPLLRAWARAGGWRARSLLLRVLGERRRLGFRECEAAFEDPNWPARLQAVKAAGLAWDLEGLEPGLRRLLRDPVAEVRREAFLALARRAELDPETWRRALKSDSLRGEALRVWLAFPERFPPSCLEDLLRYPKLRLPLLRALPGRLPEACERVLLRWEEKLPDPGLRCLALLSLPEDLWGTEILDPVLRGLEQRGWRREGALRLGSAMSGKWAARLCEGLFSLSPARLRDRLVIVRRIDLELASRLLGDLGKCPAPLAPEVLRWLHAMHPRLLLRRAAEVLTGSPSRAVARLWLRSFGTELVREGRAKLVASFLPAGGEVGEAAFQAMIGAKRYDPRLLDLARADPDRRVSRCGRLLVLAREVPAPFWLELLEDRSARLRWTAAKALLFHAADPEVPERLTRRLAHESKPAVRAALLSTLLSGIPPSRVPQVLDWVVVRKDRSLDEVLLRHLETGNQGWIPDALSALAATRLSTEALIGRVVRGDAEAGRMVLSRLESFSERQLTKARNGLSRLLTPKDLGWIEERLRGNRTPEWLKLELVEWLRLRRDLDSGGLLERGLRDLEAGLLREEIAAALVERGRTDLCLSFVEDWVENGEPDGEGLLLGLLDVVPDVPGEGGVRFLLRCLIAPSLRSPRAVLEEEILASRDPRPRLAALQPLTLPVLEKLGRADPEAVARGLLREQRVPRIREAWRRMPKESLTRILRSSVRVRGAEGVLRPLLAWALRLGPRPVSEDGILLLLEARALARRGGFAEAARMARAGLSELFLQGFSEARFERLAADLVPLSEGRERAALEVLRLWFEARAAARAGDRPGFLRSLRAARVAARGDSGLLRWLGRLSFSK